MYALVSDSRIHQLADTPFTVVNPLEWLKAPDDIKTVSYKIVNGTFVKDETEVPEPVFVEKELVARTRTLLDSGILVNGNRVLRVDIERAFAAGTTPILIATAGGAFIKIPDASAAKTILETFGKYNLEVQETAVKALEEKAITVKWPARPTVTI